MKKVSNCRSLHVFLVASPIVQIVASLVIKKLGLSEREVLCVVVRESDTSLIKAKKITYKMLSIDRILSRLFQFSYSDTVLRRRVEASCDNFYVYCAWFDRTVEQLVNSPKCSGHYYMEEGQLAYYKNKEFDADVEYRERARRKAEGSNDYHYRSDALGYYGLNNHAFPSISDKRKTILSDFSGLLEEYCLKLAGIQRIAVLPTPHRIDEVSIENLIDVYLENIGPDGVIKLHPGFSAYPALSKRVKEIIFSRGFLKESVCSNDVILELEMLHERKELFGVRSSLSTYAEILGSDYHFLDLPGYTSPIN